MGYFLLIKTPFCGVNRELQGNFCSKIGDFLFLISQHNQWRSSLYYEDEIKKGEKNIAVIFSTRVNVSYFASKIFFLRIKKYTVHWSRQDI